MGDMGGAGAEDKEDADSDVGTASGGSNHGGNSNRRRRISKKKEYRIPKTSSPNEPLVVPKDDEQAKMMFHSYSKARKMEQKNATRNKRVNEDRSLTFLDVTNAASYTAKNKPVIEKMWRKCEKKNFGLNGITVRRAGPAGETIPGTKVTSGDRRGEVVEAKMEKGYNAFTIEWLGVRGKKRSANTTEDVLRDRGDGQGVVSLDEAKKRMEVFLLATLCMINVQVHQFVTNDVNVHDAKATRPLSGEKAVDITLGRYHAWDKTKQACAVDMLMPNEVKFLDSAEDEGLLAEMEEDGSCFKMMGLDAYHKVNETGLMGSYEDFNSKHLPLVNHFVRGAQASFRLDRATSLVSSFFFL